MLRTRQARNTHLHDEKEAEQDRPTLCKNTKRVHFERLERWDGMLKIHAMSFGKQLNQPIFRFQQVC